MHSGDATKSKILPKSIRVFIVLLTCSSAQAIDFKKTDIFGSVGSDFTLAPRGNYNFGIGQKFQFKKNPAKKYRWELMATYSYENNGNHGFLHTSYSSNTWATGISRSIHIPGRFTSFVVLRSGATVYGGQDKDPRAFISPGGGFGMHIA